MTRHRDADPDILILRALDAGLLAPSRPLVVGSRAAADAVARTGASGTVWMRRGEGALPWPPDVEADAALVRLPKSRDEVAMTLHAAAARVAPGGSLWLWGRNDEGIRPALSLMEEMFGAAETVDVRAHSRLLRATRPADVPGLRPSLADWREVREVEIAGQAQPWVSYPGLFAHGRFDPATLLLIDNLPTPKPGTRALDYGSGSGVLAAALLARQPDLDIDLLDIDAVALAAARENVPAGRTVLAERLDEAGPRYDLVVSNPPLHSGFADDFDALRALLAALPRRLQPTGRMLAVTQRRLDLRRFGDARLDMEVVAENAEFRIWRAVPARPGAGRR